MKSHCPCFAALLVLACCAPAAAQSTQEWTALLDGNQPGQQQFTIPGPLAADERGRVLATGIVLDHTPYLPIVGEVVTLLDSGGQALWSKRRATSDSITDVEASPTGGFLTLGSEGATNALRLTWHHRDGIQQWTRSIPNAQGPQSHALAVDVAGTSYLCGNDFAGGIVVAAVSASGVLAWTQNIGFGAGTASEAAGLEQGGGAVYVRAYVSLTASPFTQSLWVARLSTTGTVQWTRAVPGQTSDHPLHSYDALHADPGGVVIGGETDTAGGAPHLGLLARYDAGGTLQWSSTIAGTFYDSCLVERIEAATDGTLWVQSESASVQSPPPLYGNMLVSRFDPQGATLSSTSYQAPSDQRVFATGLVLGDAGQAWIPVVAFQHQLTPWFRIHTRLLTLDADGALTAVEELDPTSTVNDELLYSTCAAPRHRLIVSGGEGGSAGDVAFALQLDLNDSPQEYCTAKVNSLGCTPALTFTGLPSASASQGFSVRAGNVRDHEAGMYLYSVAGPAAAPLQGGTLCVQAPIQRTTPINSGGTTGCTGVYQLDFNAFAHGALGGNPSPSLLVAGTAVYCQAWGRDPGFSSPNNTTLSSGLAFVVLP